MRESEVAIHLQSLIAENVMLKERNSRIADSNVSLSGELLRLEDENAELRAKTEDLTKSRETYNDIAIPSKGLKQIEAELKLCDKYTANAIADYLVLDSYELVRNLAKTANSSNASEVIAYRDGALSRNEAAITVLRKIGAKEPEFKDRIRGEQRGKNEAEE